MYNFLKKNLENFQVIAQTFLRIRSLITIWKDQVQHSAMENTVFYMIFVTQNNHEECSYSQKIELMISEETMRCRKIR